MDGPGSSRRRPRPAGRRLAGRAAGPGAAAEWGEVRGPLAPRHVLPVVAPTAPTLDRMHDERVDHLAHGGGDPSAASEVTALSAIPQGTM